MRARFVAKLFVPILYQDRAFDAFDDFSDFVESISCETSESCQVRGSNPCRGAKHFGYKLAFPSCLPAAIRGASVIPKNSKVFAGVALSSLKGGFAGLRAQPPGFSADPKFSLANSPVSPVDRLRLLTAPSNTVSQELTISNSACGRLYWIE
jgi:hypothetical protein